jgi:hypothetical protein
MSLEQGTEKVDSGQPETGTAKQTTDTGTKAAEGKPSTSTGEQKTSNETDDLLYDPIEYEHVTSKLDPEVKKQIDAFKKNLQSDYSKKTLAIKTQKDKLAMVDAFQRDPVKFTKDLARRMGLQVVNQNEQNQSQSEFDNWEPQTWKEVVQKISSEIQKGQQGRRDPLEEEVIALKKTNIEQFLDKNVPDWRDYEDHMIENIKQHPSLVNDPIKLYRLSVPEEVLETKAYKKAIEKMQDKVKSAQVGGASKTNKESQEEGFNKARTFEEAVEFARKKIAKDGIRPPG